MQSTPTALTSSSNFGPLDVLPISAVLRQEGGSDLVTPCAISLGNGGLHSGDGELIVPVSKMNGQMKLGVCRQLCALPSRGDAVVETVDAEGTAVRISTWSKLQGKEYPSRSTSRASNATL
jgi:hypothetical protein